MAYKKTKRTFEEKKRAASQTFLRAVSGESTSNDAAIIAGFVAKDIPEADIKPRVNVFTFNVWKFQLGRTVRRGEHGVKGFSMREFEVEGGDGQKAKTGPRRVSVTYFHESQTDPIEQTQAQGSAA